MPITKRRHLPPPPPMRTRVKAEPFREPGRPLGDLVREYDRKASDASWAGDIGEADRYTALANDCRNRLQAGELYEVDF